MWWFAEPNSDDRSKCRASPPVATSLYSKGSDPQLDADVGDANAAPGWIRPAHAPNSHDQSDRSGSAKAIGPATLKRVRSMLKASPSSIRRKPARQFVRSLRSSLVESRATLQHRREVLSQQVHETMAQVPVAIKRVQELSAGPRQISNGRYYLLVLAFVLLLCIILLQLIAWVLQLSARLTRLYWLAQLTDECARTGVTNRGAERRDGKKFLKPEGCLSFPK
eukprot:6192699-Pleurochrysis_carterae.AAC.4